MMVSFNPYRPRFTSSMPQKNALQQQLNQKTSTPQQQLSQKITPSLQQNIDQGLNTLKALKNDTSAITKLTTGSQVLKNTATAMRNAPNQAQLQPQIQFLEDSAAHESQLARAMVNVQYKSNGEQALREQNMIELKQMMRDLNSPFSIVSQTAAKHLKIIGLSQADLDLITRKYNEEEKKNTIS